MNSTSLPSREEILEHFRLEFVENTECYLLLCAAPVTVRSQQVRAMNLIWALDKKEKLEGKNVAVVGGGAAGLTFAAAAATLKANVWLFEADNLMHLQLGSWHRPLHPEIYTWPEHTAFRPVSHLPQLGWTTGPAHEVAREIISKFRLIQEQCGGRLQVRPGHRALLTPDGQIKVCPDDLGDLPAFRTVVLAVGFGVEENPFDLPLNSYWRADPLDQSFLGDDNSTVVITGEGDGALIEILRICVQQPDLGPFLDKVLAVTLEDPDLLKKIKQFDGPDFRIGQGPKVEEGYRNLKAQSLPKIDDLLCSSMLRDSTRDTSSRIRKISVKWLAHKQYPFDWFSLPVNRFLVSRLLSLAERRKGPDLDLIRGVTVKTIDRWKDWYLVEYECQSGELKFITCKQIVMRRGAARYLLPGRKGPHRSVTGVFEGLSQAMLEWLDYFLNSSKQDHRVCNQPAWNKDKEFGDRWKQCVEQLETADPRPPKLLAQFVQGFQREHPEWPDHVEFVYRIRIWLENVSRHLTVTYELHPEERDKPVLGPNAAQAPGKPIRRVGIGEEHELWINTKNDYEIRLRTSDGLEWKVGTVKEALKEGKNRRRETDEITLTTVDGQLVKKESWDKALECIGKQTELLRTEGWLP